MNKSATHAPAVMARLKGLHLRYSYRNWSDAFRCPACGHQERRSLNFLGGGKVLLCDGATRKRADRNGEAA